MQSYFCFFKKNSFLLLTLSIWFRSLYFCRVSFGVCWYFPFYIGNVYLVHACTFVEHISHPLRKYASAFIFDTSLIERHIQKWSGIWHFHASSLHIELKPIYIYISRPLNAKYDRQSHKYKSSHLAKNPATHFPNCFGKYFVLADAKIYPHM